MDKLYNKYKKLNKRLRTKFGSPAEEELDDLLRRRLALAGGNALKNSKITPLSVMISPSVRRRERHGSSLYSNIRPSYSDRKYYLMTCRDVEGVQKKANADAAKYAAQSRERRNVFMDQGRMRQYRGKQEPELTRMLEQLVNDAEKEQRNIMRNRESIRVDEVYDESNRRNREAARRKIESENEVVRIEEAAKVARKRRKARLERLTTSAKKARRLQNFEENRRKWDFLGDRGGYVEDRELTPSRRVVLRMKQREARQREIERRRNMI